MGTRKTTDSSISKPAAQDEWVTFTEDVHIDDLPPKLRLAGERAIDLIRRLGLPCDFSIGELRPGWLLTGGGEMGGVRSFFAHASCSRGMSGPSGEG
jgi:hypothetical protein